MSDADDLDDLLRPKGPSARQDWQDRVRQLTLRRVRHRSHMRQLAFAAALAACYVAGAATVWLARPSAPTVVVIEHEPPGQEPPAPVSSPEVPRSPRALEVAAEKADGAESARLYLEAGRHYGNDWNDWQSALRCYRNSLDLSAEIPAIDPNNDDWLLVKLKTDRRENHANP